MGLFGSPPDQLVQRFRDAAQVIAPEESLPIRPQDVSVYRWKTDQQRFVANVDHVNRLDLCVPVTSSEARFQFDPTEAEHIEAEALGVRTTVSRPSFSVACLSETVDTLFGHSSLRAVDVALEAVSRNVELLSTKNARSIAEPSRLAPADACLLIY